MVVAWNRVVPMEMERSGWRVGDGEKWMASRRRQK